MNIAHSCQVFSLSSKTVISKIVKQLTSNFYWQYIHTIEISNTRYL